MLFADDFYEDAVGEFAFEKVDYAVLHVAFEDLAGGLGGRLRRRSIRRRPAGWLTRSCANHANSANSARRANSADRPPHPAIHGLIGQAVRFPVAAA